MYIDVSCKHIIKTDYGFCDTLRFFLRIKPKIDWYIVWVEEYPKIFQWFSYSDMKRESGAKIEEKRGLNFWVVWKSAQFFSFSFTFYDFDLFYFCWGPLARMEEMLFSSPSDWMFNLLPRVIEEASPLLFLYKLSECSSKYGVHVLYVYIYRFLPCYTFFFLEQTVG